MNSNLLRAALAQQGMTQGKLAELVGISPNSLSRKRNGKRPFFFDRKSQIRNERGPNPCHFPNWNGKPSSLATRKEHEQ